MWVIHWNTTSITFHYLLTYLWLPLNYESLRAKTIFNSFETCMYNTGYQNLGSWETIVKWMNFYFQNSVLISNRGYILQVSHLLQKNLGPSITFLSILGPCLIFTSAMSPSDLSQDRQCFGCPMPSPSLRSHFPLVSQHFLS